MPSAFVTGASRGVGRGAAIALNDAGYNVFATGRTIAAANLPDNIQRIPCDHLRDDQTDAAFQTLADTAGTLGLIVNCAWGGYERMVEDGKFIWTLPF